MTTSIAQTTSTVDLTTFVNRFITAYKKSAKNVIELATVIGETYASLNEDQFKDFCKKIGYTTRSAYVSKMKTIYSNLDRFKDVMQDLPGNYTTIYDLARMPIVEFNDLVSKGKVSPTMRAPKDVKDQCQNTMPNGIVVKIKWESMSMMGLAELTNLLDGFDQKWGCTIEMPRGIEISQVTIKQQDELEAALAANDSLEEIAA